MTPLSIPCPLSSGKYTSAIPEVEDDILQFKWKYANGAEVLFPKDRAKLLAPTSDFASANLNAYMVHSPVHNPSLVRLNHLPAWAAPKLQI